METDKVVLLAIGGFLGLLGTRLLEWFKTSAQERLHLHTLYASWFAKVGIVVRKTFVLIRLIGSSMLEPSEFAENIKPIWTSFDEANAIACEIYLLEPWSVNRESIRQKTRLLKTILLNLEAELHIQKQGVKIKDLREEAIAEVTSGLAILEATVAITPTKELAEQISDAKERLEVWKSDREQQRAEIRSEMVRIGKRAPSLDIIDSHNAALLIQIRRTGFSRVRANFARWRSRKNDKKNYEAEQKLLHVDTSRLLAVLAQGDDQIRA